jgi:hypothetical protein
MPTTGSPARSDRVSQNVAIMPNPPSKIAGFPFTLSISVTAELPVHVTHAVITAANKKTGLRTNRRISRMASAANVARATVVPGRARA